MSIFGYVLGYNLDMDLFAVESAKKFNAELRREVNDRNETNCSLKREMHCLKHLVSKLKLMCCHYKRLIVDKDSQHISLNNQIDLVFKIYFILA